MWKAINVPPKRVSQATLPTSGSAALGLWPRLCTSLNYSKQSFSLIKVYGTKIEALLPHHLSTGGRPTLVKAAVDSHHGKMGARAKPSLQAAQQVCDGAAVMPHSRGQ